MYGSSIAHLVGTGKGRGSALMFIAAGILNVAVACCAFAYRPLRYVDTDLLDQIDTATTAAAAVTAAAVNANSKKTS